MAYTNVWSDTNPTGSEAANTIDDIFRSLKVDIEQRFIDIFAMPNFTDDPLRPYGIKFTDVQDAVVSLGDNAGTPRNLKIKNKAGSTTYLTIGLTHTSSVLFNFSAGIAVTGTSALGAITGTTLVLTSTANIADTITSTKLGAVIQATAASTALKYIELGNTGGLGALLIASSTGGTPSGASAYATVLYSENATALELGSNGIIRLSISSAGAFDFKSNTISSGAINSQTISATANFTGSVTVANGFTVTAGTSAHQAITGTTLNLSSTLAVTGTSTFSSTPTVQGTSNALIVINTTSGVTSNSQYISYQNASTEKWRVGNDISGSSVDAYEIYSSSGVKYGISIANATGIVTLPNGGVVTTGGFTVSAGTAAFQAITTTTISATSTITTTSSYQISGVDVISTATTGGGTFAVLAGGYGSGRFIKIPMGVIGGALGASAAVDGALWGDTTNNRLVFYMNGNRYYVAGTAF